MRITISVCTLVCFLLGSPIFSGAKSPDECRATQLLRLDGHETPLGHHVESIVFSADGRTLATYLRDEVIVWDVQTGELLWRLNSRPASIGLSPDGRILATGERAGFRVTARLWTLERDRSAHPLGPQEGDRRRKPVDRVVFSPNGKILVTKSRHHYGNGETWIAFWDVETGESLHGSLGTSVISDMYGEVPFAFSPDGSVFALGRRSRISYAYVGTSGLVDTLKRFRIRAQTAPLMVDEGYITSVAFSFDGRMLAAAARQKDVYVWNLETGELLVKWTPEGEAEVISFSPEDSTLYVVGPYRVAQLNPGSGKVLRIVKIEFTGSYSRYPIALSSDCKIVAMAEPGGIVRLWSIR